jgi:hypothetical protein
MGEGNRWSPADLDASVVAASCWLIRTDALDKVGGWRMSWEDRAVPSQALLFRLWRRGFRIYTLNDLTLVIITAGTRPVSYLRRETPEHDWVAQHLDDPAFASELAARMPSTNAFADNRAPRRPPPWRRALATILAHIGIHPWVPLVGMRHAWRRGGYVRHLREFLTLDGTGLRDAAPAVRAEAARRCGCGIAIGTPADFRVGAGGTRYLGSGWSSPEDDGVWSDGPSASLMFDLGSPPLTDLRFDFSLAVFQNASDAPREVGIETIDGEVIDRWTLSAPAGDWSIRIPASAWVGSRIDLRFHFDEAKSPSQLGLSADRRALSIKLRSVCIFQPSTP